MNIVKRASEVTEANPERKQPLPRILLGFDVPEAAGFSLLPARSAADTDRGQSGVCAQPR